MADGNEMEAALARTEKQDGIDLEDGLSVYHYVETKKDPRGGDILDSETGQPIVLAEFDFKAKMPTDGQLTFLMASMGRGQTGGQRVAAVVNFLDAVLDPQSSDYLNSRLLSREDQFPPEGIEKVFRHFSEEWFGRPTR